MTDVLTWPVGRADEVERRDIGGTRPAPGLPVAAYLVGSLAGGATTGLLLGLVGLGAQSLSGPIVVGTAGAVGIFAMALELRLRVRPLPERARQVPRRWLDWQSRELTALAFGAMIGAGFLTRLEHASAYVLAALAVLAPTPLTALAIGACYGLIRGMTLATTWLADRLMATRPRWEQLTSRRREVALLLGTASAAALIASVTAFHT